MFKVIFSACVAACVSTSAFAATVTGGSGILTTATANQLETWLGEGPIGLTAIFSKTTGSRSSDFHAAADGKGRTFSVIELDNGNVIGGYNPLSWESSSRYLYQSNSTAFLFNLTTSVKYDHTRSTHVTYNRINYGPTFGGGHDLYVNQALSGGYANIGYNYGDTSQYGRASYRNAFTGSYSNWTITKLDVFTIAPIAAVPLPAGGALLLTGLVGFAAFSRRKTRGA
ncbi:MAG: PEP_CTERM-anchored TLD domain-containing protein [Pseudomonadota bacterium]